MKRKIEIRQQASWILRVKPRKILKAIGEGWQQACQDTDLLHHACQKLCRCHEKQKATASVKDKDKGKAEANMVANGDALVASSFSNGCGVLPSVLSSSDMSLNPRIAIPRPARIRSKTRSLAGFPDSFCSKGREEGSCLNDRASHRDCAKNKGTLGDAQKDTETTNPNLEWILESPKDLVDRGALDLLLFAIQATAEADTTRVEEASNVPLPESHLILGSFPIRRKRIVRRARSVFRNCSHSVEEATRTPSPQEERSREQEALQQLTEYDTEHFLAKLCSINNDKDDNAAPVLRSKCGRARALPIKFCDSVLQPWY